MKWFSKLPKDTKVVLIIATILVFVSGARALYAIINPENRLEKINNNSRLNFVSLDEFRTFVIEKEVADLEYDIEKDIFTGSLKEEAKIKYGFTGSGRVALGNISELVEENQITNEVILETINN